MVYNQAIVCHVCCTYVQTCKNKNSLFSNTIPVKCEKTSKNNVSFFPNSSKKNIEIEFKNILDKNILLVLRDIKGNEYFSKAIIGKKNESIIVVPTDKIIPKGRYLIIASSEDEIYSQTIFIE